MIRIEIQEGDTRHKNLVLDRLMVDSIEVEPGYEGPGRRLIWVVDQMGAFGCYDLDEVDVFIGQFPLKHHGNRRLKSVADRAMVKDIAKCAGAYSYFNSRKNGPGYCILKGWRDYEVFSPILDRIQKELPEGSWELYVRQGEGRAWFAIGIGIRIRFR